MQNYLRDILADPPYDLGRPANLLLLVSVILLVSVFWFKVEDKEIMLNLSYEQQAEVRVPGDAQVANQAYSNLYPKVRLGQMVSKKDTLFIGIDGIERKRLDVMRAKLANSKLYPTAEMIEQDFLSQNVKDKMLALAKVQAGSKSVKVKKISKAKKQKVQEQIAYFKQEAKSLEMAIPKFVLVEKMMEKNFFALRDRYESDQSLLEDLKKAKDKITASELDTKQRRGQLKTAKLRIREFESELEFLNKPTYTKQKIIKADVIAIEIDLAKALDSLWTSKLVLSDFSGQIAHIGKLDEVSTLDTLIMLEGTLEKANRSKLIYATAKHVDASRIYPGTDLKIFLQDGSSIQGEVVNTKNDAQSNNSQVEIASEEELSYVDIDQIVIPLKNSNFIEKVLENF